MKLLGPGKSFPCPQRVCMIYTILREGESFINPLACAWTSLCPFWNAGPEQSTTQMPSQMLHNHIQYTQPLFPLLKDTIKNTHKGQRLERLMFYKWKLWTGTGQSEVFNLQFCHHPTFSGLRVSATSDLINVVILTRAVGVLTDGSATKKIDTYISQQKALFYMCCSDRPVSGHTKTPLLSNHRYSSSKFYEPWIPPWAISRIPSCPNTRKPQSSI